MKQIEKYRVTDPDDLKSAIGYHRVDIPSGGKVLDVSIDAERVFLHVLVNPKHKKRERWFAIYREGVPMDNYEKKHYEYIGRLNKHHIFEVHD